MSYVKSNILEQIVYSASNFAIIFFATRQFDLSDSDWFSLVYSLSVFGVTFNASYIFSSIYNYSRIDKKSVQLAVIYVWSFFFGAGIFIAGLCVQDLSFLYVFFGVLAYDFARRYFILFCHRQVLGISIVVLLVRMLSFVFGLETKFYLIIWFVVPALIGLMAVFISYINISSKKLSVDFILKYNGSGFIGIGSGSVDYAIQYMPILFLFQFGVPGAVTNLLSIKNLLGVLSTLYQYIDTVVFRNLSSSKIRHAYKLTCICLILSLISAPVFWYLGSFVLNLLEEKGYQLFREGFVNSDFITMLIVYLLYPIIRIFLLIVRILCGMLYELKLGIFNLILNCSLYSLFFILIGVSLKSVTISILASHVVFSIVLFYAIKKQFALRPTS